MCCVLIVYVLDMFDVCVCVYLNSSDRFILRDMQRRYGEAFVMNDNRYRHTVRFCEIQELYCWFDAKLYAYEDRKYDRFSDSIWDDYEVPIEYAEEVRKQRIFFNHQYRELIAKRESDNNNNNSEGLESFRMYSEPTNDNSNNNNSNVNNKNSSNKWFKKDKGVFVPIWEVPGAELRISYSLSVLCECIVYVLYICVVYVLTEHMRLCYIKIYTNITNI